MILWGIRMAKQPPRNGQTAAADDFQDAAAAAEMEVRERGWSEMLPGERSRAIYSSLRRTDAKRVVALHFVAAPHGRFRVAGEYTKHRPMRAC
jgi:hypothetical protein